MNIYEKLARARAKFHSLDLKKSGHNKFAGYKYFELADFLVPGLKCLHEENLIPVVSFTKELATMKVFHIERGDSIEITSPMASANLKGCHEIQNLGAVETYQRRYLWMCLLEIVEHDAVDSAEPVHVTVKGTVVPNKPATDEQLVELDDFDDYMDDKQREWLAEHKKTMTYQQAKMILDKLKEKAA